jgi:subtilisin family serine protease
VKGFWKLLALMLCLAVSNYPAGAVMAQANGKPGDGASNVEPSHQLLVMLHMPSPHFRPGSNYSGRYVDDPGHSARLRVAKDIAQAHNLTLVSDWPMPALGVDCYVMEAATVDALSHSLDMLSHDLRVEWVQPMSTYHSLANNERLYSLQPSAKYWHLTEIHKAVTGRNIRMAIIDSGVDDRHPDLTGQVTLKENFIDDNPYVSESHGTAVAGIIGASAHNGAGIEGVASDAHLMALRACWEVTEHDTRCNSFSLGKALNFAILHKAQVINLSLTGPPDRLLQRLLDVALTQGITVVGAADPHSADGGFPASYPGVLAVADEDAKPVREGMLMAPGRDIPTTAPDGRWSFVNGASFACAHVSGMVALLVELNPSFTPTQIRQELKFNSTSSNDGRPAGAIDACATISKSVGSCICACPLAHASKDVH